MYVAVSPKAEIEGRRPKPYRRRRKSKAEGRSRIAEGGIRSPSTFRENCCAPTKSASDASPFWAIVRDFFSFSTLHPSTKGHRDLELRRLGVILDGESDFRGFIYLFFYKK